MGVAKSGTTYLQAKLFENRRALRRHGVLYPGRRHDDQYLASLDLRSGSRPREPVSPRQRGAWDRLAGEVRRFHGRAVVSHETLARCSPEEINRAVHSFERPPVQVVLTLRDLGRQVPAVWQESIKNRRQVPYTEFLETILRSRQGRRRGGRFWQPQDVAAVAERWATAVGPERVTLVTVPPPGAPRDLLWRRFAEATGLPELEYAEPSEGANPSLSRVEAELLRRLNPHLAELTWNQYASRIKHGLAERTLVDLSRGSRITVPEEYRDDVRAAAAGLVGALRAGGYRVVGDLEELAPVFGDTGGSPDEVEEGELLETVLALVAAMAAQENDLRWLSTRAVKGGLAAARDLVATRADRLRRL